jgi:hypothetical protein
MKTDKMIYIGDLPQEVQNQLSEFCKANRPYQPVLSTVEKWSMQEIIDAYLIWNGIMGYTYQIIKLFEAIEEAQSKGE